MPDFLGTDIKKLYGGIFKFFQTECIHKVLEDTGMDPCNVLPPATRVEANLGIYNNGPKSNIDWLNSYVSSIGVILYL